MTARESSVYWIGLQGPQQPLQTPYIRVGRWGLLQHAFKRLEPRSLAASSTSHCRKQIASKAMPRAQQRRKPRIDFYAHVGRTHGVTF